MFREPHVHMCMCVCMSIYIYIYVYMYVLLQTHAHKKKTQLDWGLALKRRGNTRQTQILRPPEWTFATTTLHPIGLGSRV